MNKNKEDYVIVHTHESKPHPMSMGDSNYMREVVGIFSTKEFADNEIRKPQYEWQGNDTGSVSWKVVKRSDVTEDTIWRT